MVITQNIVFHFLICLNGPVVGKRFSTKTRITSYNVCYTKLLRAVMTWIIPSGEFERTQKTMSNGKEKTVIVENSFHKVDSEPQTWQVFTSIYNGFVAQSHIIVFIRITSYNVCYTKLLRTDH